MAALIYTVSLWIFFFKLFLLRYMLITVISRATLQDLDYWAVHPFKYSVRSQSESISRAKFTSCVPTHCSLSVLAMSANQNCFYLEQLSQFVCDPNEGHFGGSDVNFLSCAKKLVALGSFEELLCPDFSKKLPGRAGPAVDLLQQAVFWFDLKGSTFLFNSFKVIVW